LGQELERSSNSVVFRRGTVSAHEEAEIDAPAKAYTAAVDKQLFSVDIESSG